MDREELGKFYASGYRVRDMLEAFANTTCGHECKVRITQVDKSIDIEIRTCVHATPCFVELLNSQRTLN